MDSNHPDHPDYHTGPWSSDYRILHTFAPTTEMYGVLADALEHSGTTFHALVVYLAMVEYVTNWQGRLRERAVFLFAVNGQRIIQHRRFPGPSGTPCDIMLNGALVCAGHKS